KTILIISIIFTFLFINSNIIINEVMANVEGRDSGVMSPGDRNEFIEIYNASSDTIVLNGYRLFDGNAYDNIIKWIDSISPEKGIVNVNYLPPQCYGIILDPEYCLIGDELNMPYEFSEETYIFTISNTTFGDNGLSTVDCISLFDNDGEMISSFGTPNIDDGFPNDCGDGVSIERVNPYAIDNPGNWKPCNDLSGNSAGIRNSVYTENAVIDTMIYHNNTLTIYFAYMPINGADLIIEYPCSMDTINVFDDSIDIDVGKQDVFNVNIKNNPSIYTFIKPIINNKYKIFFNEFFVKSSDKEWMEIKNECGIDYYGDLRIINNDTLIVKDIIIPNGGYFVIAEDTQLLKYDYPYIPNCLYVNEVSISLPDRQDTFLLLINGLTIDSIIRGYEDMGDRSIEKINGTKGYKKLNWDMCVDDY
ncbi:lamin tail domain-containing protein, partial [candidate division WOR-3 bacterium]|nr:lamin tail domain-containing protein [candidate division WOR-3 bacterium]